MRARPGHVRDIHLDRVVDESYPTVPAGVVGDLLVRQACAQRGEEVDRTQVGEPDADEVLAEPLEGGTGDRERGRARFEPRDRALEEELVARPIGGAELDDVADDAADVVRARRRSSAPTARRRRTAAPPWRTWRRRSRASIRSSRRATGPASPPPGRCPATRSAARPSARARAQAASRISAFVASRRSARRSRFGVPTIVRSIEQC